MKNNQVRELPFNEKILIGGPPETTVAVVVIFSFFITQLIRDHDNREHEHGINARRDGDLPLLHGGELNFSTVEKSGAVLSAGVEDHQVVRHHAGASQIVKIDP